MFLNQKMRKSYICGFLSLFLIIRFFKHPFFCENLTKMTFTLLMVTICNILVFIFTKTTDIFYCNITINTLYKLTVTIYMQFCQDYYTVKHKKIRHPEECLKKLIQMTLQERHGSFPISDHRIPQRGFPPPQ